MSKENQKQGVVFARVSSRTQELEGFSLDAQVGLLKEYCERKNIGIKRVFQVSETASRSSERKKFLECLEYLRKHRIQCLVIEKVDRLTRNYQDYVRVDEWIKAKSGNEVHSVKDNQVLSQTTKSQETLMWDIKVTLAKNTSANLSEEVKKGQLEKLQQGWLPKEPPMGYRTIIVEGKHLHEIDPDKAALVIKGFELYAAPGGTIAGTAEKLAKLGLKTIRGKLVTKNNIDIMLDNKFYIGINRWNGYEVPGKQESIIREELWEAVQAKKHGEEPRPKYKRHAALLRGLVNCKHCERLIVWQQQKGRYYGRCNGGCKVASYAREEDVEATLLDTISRSTTKKPEVYDWLKGELKGYVRLQNAKANAERSHIEKLITTQQNKQETLYDDRLEGVITIENYKQLSERVKLAIAELESELAVVNKSTVYVSENSVKIVSLCTQALASYTNPKASQDLKWEILAFYFGKVTWDGTTLNVQLSELADLVVSLGKTAQKAKQKVEPQSNLCKMGSSEPSCPTWQGRQDLNLRHPVLETGALPTELLP